MSTNSRMAVSRLTDKECRDQRAAALDRLDMTLEEARDQWAECRCCLRNFNYDDQQDLDEVRDMDYLLGEGDYA